VIKSMLVFIIIIITSDNAGWLNLNLLEGEV